MVALAEVEGEGEGVVADGERTESGWDRLSSVRSRRDYCVHVLKSLASVQHTYSICLYESVILKRLGISPDSRDNKIEFLASTVL